MTLLDQLPEWQAHMAEQRRLDLVHNRLAGDLLAAERAYEDESRAYRAALDSAALGEGEVPETVPAPPAALRDAVHRSAARRLHDNSGAELRQRLAPAVERLARERARERAEQVRAAAQELLDAAAAQTSESNEVAALWNEVDGGKTRPSRSDRLLTRWDAGTLAVAAVSGADAYALEPLPAPQRGVDHIEVTRHPDIVRALQRQ